MARAMWWMWSAFAQWFVGYTEIDFSTVCAHCAEEWRARMRARGVERGRQIGGLVDVTIIVLALTRLPLATGILVVALYQAAAITMVNIYYRTTDLRLINQLTSEPHNDTEDQP